MKSKRISDLFAWSERNKSITHSLLFWEKRKSNINFTINFETQFLNTVLSRNEKKKRRKEKKRSFDYLNLIIPYTLLIILYLFKGN